MSFIERFFLLYPVLECSLFYLTTWCHPVWGCIDVNGKQSGPRNLSIILRRPVSIKRGSTVFYLTMWCHLVTEGDTVWQQICG